MIKIDIEKCAECGICEEVCVNNAVNSDYAVIYPKKCDLCCNCLAVCPKQAITFESIPAEDAKEASVSPDSFGDLVRNRRSCRNYLPKPVDQQTISQITGPLAYSPTGGNLRGVNVTVLDTGAKVQKLSRMVRKLFMASSKPGYLLAPFLGLTNTKDFLNLVKRLKTGGKDILTHNAPAMLLFHSDPKRMNTPAEDCNIAAMVAVLQAEVSGLGTCFNGYISIGLNFSGKIKKALGIPRKNKVYAALTMGYPKYKYRNAVYREKINVNFPKI